jgi:methanogenic corrinoid protein MtbC1
VNQPLGSSASLSPQALGRDYLRHLLTPDGRAARRLVDEALAAGVPAVTLYLRVIAPAMYEVGRLWETAQISVAQEHLATQITQVVIATLGLQLDVGERVGAGRTAIVSSTPGELHALGGQMVADFLEAQGWSVLALGADAPADELFGLAQARPADVVALSTALPGNLPSVARTCRLLGQLTAPPFIVVGGHAYGGDQSRARAVGADAFAADPQALVDLLRLRFGGPAPA